MLTTNTRSFVLLIDNKVDAVAKDWDNMRDYCSETGKRGQVFLVETKFPFSGDINSITTTKSFFGEIQ
jgi:hypothetical protein